MKLHYLHQTFLLLVGGLFTFESGAQQSGGSTQKPNNSVQVFSDCDHCPTMVEVPSGEFLMGDRTGEGQSNEGPVRKVSLRGSFAVSVYETTFEEYNRCVSSGDCAEISSGPGEGREDHPVDGASWDNARQYAAWLSKSSGRQYRLLTEAEWEYALRAGSTTKYHFGDEISDACKFGNLADRSAGFSWGNDACSDGIGEGTSAVGSYQPNAFGLHDMIGNVWEWVEDCYFDSHANAPADGSARQRVDCDMHVLRGASWYNGPGYVLSSFRVGKYPTYANVVGFRVARDVE